MHLLNFHKTSMYIAVAPAKKYHKSEYLRENAGLPNTLLLSTYLWLIVGLMGLCFSTIVLPLECY